MLNQRYNSEIKLYDQKYKQSKNDYSILCHNQDTVYEMFGGETHAYETICIVSKKVNEKSQLKKFGFDHTITRSLIKNVPNIVIDAFNSITEKSINLIIDNQTKIMIASKFDTPQKTSGFNEYSIVSGDNRLIVITYFFTKNINIALFQNRSEKKEKVIACMSILENIPIQKKMYFYESLFEEIPIFILDKTSFSADDPLYLFGPITIYHPLIEQMKCTLQFMIENIASSETDIKISMKITEFLLKSEPEIKLLLNTNEFVGIKPIVLSLNNLNKLGTNKLPTYSTCTNQFRNAPTSLKKYQKIYQSIGSTVCNYIYYTYSPDIVNIVMKYPYIVELIVSEHMKNINPIMETWSSENFKQHMIDIPKLLPSTIENKFILLKNNNDNFVNPRDEFKVIFDSGNSSITLIGSEIVKQLGLKINKGCVIITSGIGGQAKPCGNYVNITYKFSPDFGNGIDKEYNMLAFIDETNITDTLLFGHASGLDHLFADNFSIKGEYSKGDVRSQKNPEIVKNIINEHKKLNIILDKYLENPELNITILYNIANNNQNMIHRYMTGVDENIFTNTFKKLDHITNILKSSKKPQEFVEGSKKYLALYSIVSDMLNNKDEYLTKYYNK
jgi:hypothetical protein